MTTQSEKLCVTPQRQIFSTPAKDRHQSISIAQVRVIVRLRPFLPHEISSRNGHPISCVSLQESEASPSNEVTVLLKDQATRLNLWIRDLKFSILGFRMSNWYFPVDVAEMSA